MSKRNKIVAKLHSELKDKETSLKAKINKETDEAKKKQLIEELYAVQYRLKRGAPNFGADE